MNVEAGYRSALPILIVDDDPSFLSIVKASLARAEWRHEVATAGQAAIACLADQPFGAVLLDLKLPDMSGIDVLRAIASLPNAPPVLLISGDASVRDALEAGHLGAVDFLEKPVAMHDLLAKLAETIHRRSPITAIQVPKPAIVAAIAELILRVVRSPDDVRTVSDWARLVSLTEKTLTSRCGRLGLTAKRVLDFARLLRAVFQRPRLGAVYLMFDSLDNRTLSALTGRAGLRSRDLETLSTSAFLRKQELVGDPSLVDSLERALHTPGQRAASVKYVNL